MKRQTQLLGRSGLWFSGACVALFGAALFVMQPATQVMADDDDAPGSIGDHMSGIKKALKKTARNLSSGGSVDEALAQIQEMQVHVLAVKALEPPVLEDAPESEHQRIRIEFRVMAAKVLRELIDMEIDVAEGRTAEAMARIKGPLFELRDESHEKFQKKRE